MRQVLTNFHTSFVCLVRLLAMGLLLSACGVMGFNTGFKPNPERESQIMGPGADLPDIDLLAVNDSMVAYMEQHIPPHLHGWELVERLQDILFSPQYLSIQYDDTANFSAAEVFEERRANCLSLINLYIALARYQGLNVNYQTVQIRPRWSRRGELVVLNGHINALGYIGATGRYIVDFTPEVRLQHQTASTVSDEQALAMYFNNLAVEYLIDEDIDQALEYMRHALTIYPDLAIAWNNLGSVLKRKNLPDLAEYSYQKAAWLDKYSGSAYNNLARLYAQQGDMEKAERYRRAVEFYNRRNPYYHYIQGNIAYEEGQYELAQRHFNDAIERNDLEPDFYLALGMTYHQLGDEETSEKLTKLGMALRELGDPTYRYSEQRVRRVDTRSVLRSSSAGFSVRFTD